MNIKVTDSQEVLTASSSKQQNIKIKGTAFILLIIVSLVSSGLGFAQTKTIEFEGDNWEQIKARSANENKLIFLDAYASWCGICRKMDKNVFTNDSVADFFNRNFINARIDMESDEGIEIARQYNVNVYPTLLFIDGLGNVKHGAVGGHDVQETIELGRDAQDPEKQNAGIQQNAVAVENATQTNSNRTEIGLNISQYQRDFGIGLHVVSQYFMMKMVAIKAGVNMQWFEKHDGRETVLTSYQNIQVGMRSRSNLVSHGISVYGEGGVLIILPGTGLSSEGPVVGGFGLFGFEFRIVPGFAYFIELGGVGTGATADKVAGKPIYSNGFLTNVGLRVGW